MNSKSEKEERKKILERLRKNEIGGKKCALLMSGLMDRKLKALADNLLPDKIAIIALGGYGRGELCPFSDVDIMFLLEKKASEKQGEAIEKFLYSMWDAGIKVGHSTRTVKDCVLIAHQDMISLTSLLDLRLIHGPEPLFDKLVKTLKNDLGKRRQNKYVKDKLAERDQRHKKFDDSRYVLEPNIKDGKGGLRDYQSLFWIADVLYGARTPKDMAKKTILTEKEARRFAKAHDYLLTVRCHLHDVAGRAEERIHFDIQPTIANRLGYRSRNKTKSVERFMKHYFLVTRDIGDLTRIVCSLIEEREAGSKGGKPVLTKSGFQIVNGRLTFPDNLNLSKSTLEIIRLFYVAQQENLDIHPFALRRITKNLALIDSRLRRNKEANRLFLKILLSRHDAAQTLRRMNEAGVLGPFIEPFGKIIALMQFDRYHKYTVDEHTIRAIDILHSLENGEVQDETLSSEIFPKIKSRRVLYTAMFLHDICKGQGGDHSLLGAELALQLCPRLGLDDAETRLVSWLIFDHLVMADVAFKRDLEDPKTIEDFAFRIYDPEKLRLLLILTTADIMAVGPERWSTWKAKLLEDLYNKTLGQLIGKEQIRQQEKIIIPEEYETGKTLVCFEDAPEHESTRVTVYTTDKTGLFATLAGGLSAAGANIIEARINTLDDGTVADSFIVQNLSGRPFDKKWRQDQIRKSVISAINEKLDIKGEINRHLSNMPKKDDVFNIPFKVRIDNNASRNDTVIEITAKDKPGLLYSLARTLKDQELNINSAKITTHGIKAVDVFYIHDKSGNKLTDKTKIEKTLTALKKGQEKIVTDK